MSIYNLSCDSLHDILSFIDCEQIYQLKKSQVFKPLGVDIDINNWCILSKINMPIDVAAIDGNLEIVKYLTKNQQVSIIGLKYAIINNHTDVVLHILNTPEFSINQYGVDIYILQIINKSIELKYCDMSKILLTHYYVKKSLEINECHVLYAIISGNLKILQWILCNNYGHIGNDKIGCVFNICKERGFRDIEKYIKMLNNNMVQYCTKFATTRYICLTCAGVVAPLITERVFNFL